MKLEGLQQAFQQETIVAREAWSLFKREPTKYGAGVLGLYYLSRYGLEVGRLARASYYFMRHIDDALDGDSNVAEDSLEYVFDIRNQLDSGDFRGKPAIVNLAQYALSVLEEKARPGDNPRQDFLDEIDVMVFDSHRLKERRALSEQELSDYYRETFFPVVNIMLIGIGSQLRAEDMPELSYCQGRVYSIKDLEKDWNKGIINIPKEVLTSAGLTSESSYEAMRSNGVIKMWIKNELSQSKTRLILLQEKLMELPEETTQFLCINGLIGPMLQFVNQESKRQKQGLFN